MSDSRGTNVTLEIGFTIKVKCLSIKAYNSSAVI